MQRPSVSVLIPLYNEEKFIGEVLDRVCAGDIASEAIVVDDGSSDRSARVVEQYMRDHPGFQLRLLRHPENRGKSAAIRTALAAACGEFSIVQDADLEYDPADYARILSPLLAGEADLVIGSRFLVPGGNRARYLRQAAANKLLTNLANAAAGLKLTDMASGLKAFRTSLARTIPLESERFGFDAELPVKFARRHARIVEVPANYHGRSYAEGKKIRPRDAFALVGTILRAAFSSDLHLNPASAMLCAMENATRFNQWMADAILPYVGDDVLEIGAGIGNLTRLLCAGRRRYVVTDLDGEYVNRVAALMRCRSHISTAICDVSNAQDFEPFRGRMDTIICLNVLEHVENDLAGLRNIHSSLKPGGRAILLVPQGPFAFGSFDRILGHFRRYTKEEFETKVHAAGFSIERMFPFNRATYPGWLLNAKLLGRRKLSRLQLALFDRAVPLARRLDPYLPWPATSLIAICTPGPPLRNKT
ncbi:MAG: glycosyltransferase [Bryobacteraceae bacterium]